MKEKIMVLVFGLCCLLIAVGAPMASAAGNGVSQKDIDSVVKALKGIQFESLMFLSYQSGRKNGNGTDYSLFNLKRGYFGIKKTITPWFSARFTTDISHDADGSYRPRIKYLYGQFHLPSDSLFTKPSIEFGQVHMPWLDFEEHVDFFRLQDPMFIERNGVCNSADDGITFSALLGGTMDRDYQKTVNSHYPGRYGSVSVGVYNGGGYHATEQNTNKVVMARLTVRPIPDIIPGLQFSYFGTTGKGNTAAAPDWSTNLFFASYEQKYITVTGQYYTGTGSQSGADEYDKDGYSFFTEIKPSTKVSLIGRYDHFDPNTHMKNDGNSTYIIGAAYMLDKPHKNMILVDYQTVTYEDSSKTDDGRFQVTLQVAF